MWTRENWNAIDPEQPAQRTVEITLDEYRELVKESAAHGETVRKKDEEISELRRKVQKLTDALTSQDETDDGE